MFFGQSPRLLYLSATPIPILMLGTRGDSSETYVPPSLPAAPLPPSKTKYLRGEFR